MGMRSGVDQLNSPIMMYDSLLPPLIRSVYMLQSVWSAVESLCQVEAIEHTGFGDEAMYKTADGKEVLSRPFQPSVAACIGLPPYMGQQKEEVVMYIKPLSAISKTFMLMCRMLYWYTQYTIYLNIKDLMRYRNTKVGKQG